jgi:hypothetical protein
MVQISSVIFVPNIFHALFFGTKFINNSSLPLHIPKISSGSFYYSPTNQRLLMAYSARFGLKHHHAHPGNCTKRFFNPENALENLFCAQTASNQRLRRLLSCIRRASANFE